jgi:homoserine kinase
VEILTKDARNILSKEVELEKMIAQTGNLGGLIVGLYNADYDLISRSLNDVVIEPQRSKLIPHFYKVKQAALDNGALGCSISGAGPSIFALCANSYIAENVGEKMQAVFIEHQIESELFLSSINQEGAIKL